MRGPLVSPTSEAHLPSRDGNRNGAWSLRASARRTSHRFALPYWAIRRMVQECVPRFVCGGILRAASFSPNLRLADFVRIAMASAATLPLSWVYREVLLKWHHVPSATAISPLAWFRFLCAC